VSAGFICDDLQHHTMDDGKKELDVDDVEQYDNDAVDNDDAGNNDRAPDLEDHDEEQKVKDGVDAADDYENDALDVSKLDDVPEQCQHCHQVGILHCIVLILLHVV
jgi:hypothetical protein